jgi:hypothetical protein
MAYSRRPRLRLELFLPVFSLFLRCCFPGTLVSITFLELERALEVKIEALRGTVDSII